MIPPSSSANTYVVAPPLSQDTTGLLDDMLKEADALSRNENPKFGNCQAEDYNMAPSKKGKYFLDGIVQNGVDRNVGSAFGNRKAGTENQWADSGAAQMHAGEFMQNC